MDRILKLTVSFGGVGYLPLPGTAASAVTVLIVLLFPRMCWVIAFFVLATALGYLLSGRAVDVFGTKDPRPFVLDECSGMTLTLVGVPLDYGNLLAAFFLFRFFDVVKPLGIRRIDAWGHAASIMTDDVVAGLYANLVLQAALIFLGRFAA